MLLLVTGARLAGVLASQRFDRTPVLHTASRGTAPSDKVSQDMHRVGMDAHCLADALHSRGP